VEPGIFRTLHEEVIIKDFLIPAGTHVYMRHDVNGLHPRWTHEPLEFRPERWLRKEKTTSCPVDITDFKMGYKPFGHGRRQCSGRILVQQEVGLLLVEILENFRISYHHDDIGSITKQFNVPDKPLLFRFDPL
jgi:cytochrome P450